jgi:hypothetical protein
VPSLFRAFDFPGPDASSPRRDSTLVPQQALFLMNSPFALHAARGLERRAAARSGAERVRLLYRLCYGRAPSADEEKLAEAFAGTPADRQRYAHALLLANELSFID